MQKIRIKNSDINQHFDLDVIELDLNVGQAVAPMIDLNACLAKDDALDEDMILIGSVEKEEDGSGFQAFVYIYMKFTNAFSPREVRASMPMDSLAEAEKARFDLMNDLYHRFTAISSKGQITVSQD